MARRSVSQQLARILCSLRQPQEWEELLVRSYLRSERCRRWQCTLLHSQRPIKRNILSRCSIYEGQSQNIPAWLHRLRSVRANEGGGDTTGYHHDSQLGCPYYPWSRWPSMQDHENRLPTFLWKPTETAVQWTVGKQKIQLLAPKLLLLV